MMSVGRAGPADYGDPEEGGNTMIELIEKYYTFTLTFIVLSIALFVFQSNKDIVNIIVGCFVGLLSAPALLPKK